uniref:Uncharacterized protein n=1 Tax=Eutreptiella gymnastica TaxID=73025 RepID=A0A7S4G2N9_9EUGL
MIPAPLTPRQYEETGVLTITSTAFPPEQGQGGLWALGCASLVSYGPTGCLASGKSSVGEPAVPVTRRSERGAHAVLSAGVVLQKCDHSVCHAACPPVAPVLCP